MDAIDTPNPMTKALEPIATPYKVATGLGKHETLRKAALMPAKPPPKV